jgi:hypothetical protein
VLGHHLRAVEVRQGKPARQGGREEPKRTNTTLENGTYRAIVAKGTGIDTMESRRPTIPVVDIYLSP